MSQGRLQAITQHYRAALRAHEAQTEHALELAYAGVLRALEPALEKLYREMMEKMADGKKIPLHWLLEAGRLKHIKHLIQREIDHFGALALVIVQQAQQYAVQLGQKSAMEMLEATVPAGVHHVFSAPHPAVIANLVGTTQNGSSLADLFHGFGSEAAQKVESALITGVTLGHHRHKLAIWLLFLLGTTRARALTISRDQLYNTYRTAVLETYRANDDVLDSWLWSALLDAQTCAVCIAMNGTEHPLSEKMESHVSCRCMPVPKTTIWADTSIQMQSGVDWFDQQSEAVQVAILGKAKQAAYQAGDLVLWKLVHHGHDAKWGGYRQEKSLIAAIGAKKAALYSKK